MSPGADSADSLAVVVEWENALEVGGDRPAQMLRRLGAQLVAWLDAPAGAPRSAEVVVVHDVELVDGAALAVLVAAELGGATRRVRLQFVAARGCRYYEQKNLGFRHTTAGRIVFVDSDVLPEAGWLEALLAPLADPAIGVVAGSTYVEPVGLYGKAMALAWIFELRPSEEGTVVARRFFANSVAFRRDVLEGERFEGAAGTSRGACRALAERLQAAGVGIVRTGAARVSHPAPGGLAQVASRGLLAGRDRLLQHRGLAAEAGVPAARRSGRSRGLGPASALRHFVRGESRALGRLVRERRAVGLAWWQLPAAAAIATTYHAAALGGDVLMRCAPSRAAQLPGR